MLLGALVGPRVWVSEVLADSDPSGEKTGSAVGTVFYDLVGKDSKWRPPFDVSAGQFISLCSNATKLSVTGDGVESSFVISVTPYNEVTTESFVSYLDDLGVKLLGCADVSVYSAAGDAFTSESPVLVGLELTTDAAAALSAVDQVICAFHEIEPGVWNALEAVTSSTVPCRFRSRPLICLSFCLWHCSPVRRQLRYWMGTGRRV